MSASDGTTIIRDDVADYAVPRHGGKGPQRSLRISDIVPPAMHRPIKQRRVPNSVKSQLREICMLRCLKHANGVTLGDTFYKAQDDEGNAGVFAWSAGIKDKSLLWSYD
ncbi:hypothetical protein HK405_014024 [Cladochytrium tenue]|nr:hypothetical protein HK405_014024 [Cladochytrium tenue]